MVPQRPSFASGPSGVEQRAVERALIELTEECVWVGDGAGATAFVNARFAALVGRDVGALPGVPFCELVAPSDRALAALVLAGAPGRFELSFLRADGTLQRCRVAARGLDGGGALAMISELRGGPPIGREGEAREHIDIGPQAGRPSAGAAERGADQRVAFVDTMFDTAPVGLAFFDRTLRCGFANRALAEIFGVGVEGPLRRRPSELVPGAIGRETEGLVSEILRTEEAVLHREMLGDTPTAPGALRTLRVSGTPVRLGGELIGAGVVVEDVTPSRAADSERRHLLANERVTRLEAERAATAAEQAIARATLLQEVTASLSGALTPAQVVEALRRRLPSLGALGGLIAMVEEDGRHLRVVVAVGFPPGAIDNLRREPVDGDSALAFVIRSGAPLYFEDGAAMRAHSPRLSFEPQLDDGAVAMVPLFAGARTIGVVGLRFVGRRRFGVDERGPIGAVAGQFANAFDRARLYEEQRRTGERSAWLARVGQALAASLDIDATLESLTRLAVPSLSEMCIIDLIDVDGGFSRAAVRSTVPGREQVALAVAGRCRVWSDDHPSAVVARTGRRVLLSELDTEMLDRVALDGEHRRLLQSMAPTSTVILPLTARGHTFGVMWLVRFEAQPRYEEAELALPDELARRGALALDNARHYRDACEAIRARDDFLSIAGHELKTPLAALKLQVQGMLRLASRGAAPLVSEVAGADYVGTESVLVTRLERARGQIARLEGLIAELLDVSRITAGRMSLEREEIDLGALVREVSERFGDEAARAGCVIVLHVPAPIPGLWDRSRLDQIVTNLLTNALKYGPDAPIEITVTAVGARAVLSVVDHGIGIELEQQRRIFGRFERAVSERHYGGLGLGLWIVAQIVDALGGTIQVVSAPGEGANFVIELPIVSTERS